MKRLNLILGKKQLVAAGLTVLLGTAVAVNFIYAGSKKQNIVEPSAEVSGSALAKDGETAGTTYGEAAPTPTHISHRRGWISRRAVRKLRRCCRVCIRAATSPRTNFQRSPWTQ